MKFLIIGCFHGKFPKKLQKIANQCDAVLSTGDLAGGDALRKLIFADMNAPLSTAQKGTLKRLFKQAYDSGIRVMRDLEKIKVPVYMIDGNWDFIDTRFEQKKYGLKLEPYQKVINKRKKMTYWGHGIRTFKGLTIYAHGGLMFASIFRKKVSGMNSRRRKQYVGLHKKQQAELFKRKAKHLDILFAHCPPYGYFDVVKSDNPMKGKHVGFQGYTDYIKKYKPSLFICGHMHECQGVKKLGRTVILSHGPAQDGKAAILEFDDTGFDVRLVK